MQSSEELQILTKRLRLRELTHADVDAVLSYQSDPRYLRYYEWTLRTRDDVVDFVQMFMDWRDEVPRYRIQLAIELRSSGRLIGNCGIRRKSGASGEADIGFELDPEYWGNGYATEAGDALVRFGFHELKLHRISSWCIADNVASKRVLEKLGLRLEGRLRENVYFKDRYWDTLVFGMLRSELSL